MKRPSKKGAFFFKLTLLPLFCVCCLSCAVHSTSVPTRQTDDLLAEYNALKKRLPLIERENDVLAKENDHYRQWVRDLESKIRHLTGELASDREAHAGQLAEKTREIEQTRNALLMLSAETARQTALLNTTIQRQKKDFGARRRKLIQESERKQALLSDQLTQTQKQLQETSLEIADLTMGLEEKSTELKALATLKMTLEQNLKSERQKNLELSAANEEITKALTEANETIAALKKARDKSMAELESAKSDNAELIKTFNELFNQLQLEKDRSGTKI